MATLLIRRTCNISGHYPLMVNGWNRHSLDTNRTTALQTKQPHLARLNRNHIPSNHPHMLHMGEVLHRLPAGRTITIVASHHCLIPALLLGAIKGCINHVNKYLHRTILRRLRCTTAHTYCHKPSHLGLLMR